MTTAALPRPSMENPDYDEFDATGRSNLRSVCLTPRQRETAERLLDLSFRQRRANAWFARLEDLAGMLGTGRAKAHEWLSDLERFGIVVIEERRGRKYGWLVAFQRDRRQWKILDRHASAHQARQSATREEYLARRNRDGDPQRYLIAPPLTWSDVEDGRQAGHQAALQTSTGQVVRQTPANLSTGRIERQHPAGPTGLISEPQPHVQAAETECGSFPDGQRVGSPGGNELVTQRGTNQHQLVPQRGTNSFPGEEQTNVDSFPRRERTSPENRGPTRAGVYPRDVRPRGLAKLSSEASQVLSEGSQGPCVGQEPEAKKARRHVKPGEFEDLMEALESVHGPLWPRHCKQWQGKCRRFPDAVWEALAELKVRREHPTLEKLKLPGGWVHDKFKEIIGERPDRSSKLERSAVATRQAAAVPPRAAGVTTAPPTASGISPTAPASRENAPSVHRATEGAPSLSAESSTTSSADPGKAPGAPQEAPPSYERCREFMAGLKAQLARAPAPAVTTRRQRHAASPRPVPTLQAATS